MVCFKLTRCILTCAAGSRYWGWILICRSSNRFRPAVEISGSDRYFFPFQRVEIWFSSFSSQTHLRPSANNHQSQSRPRCTANSGDQQLCWKRFWTPNTTSWRCLRGLLFWGERGGGGGMSGTMRWSIWLAFVAPSHSEPSHFSITVAIWVSKHEQNVTSTEQCKHF